MRKVTISPEQYAEYRELKKNRDSEVSSAGLLSDTERLDALFTLLGGGYAFPVHSLTNILKDGRSGIDRLIKENPSLVSDNVKSEVSSDEHR